MAETNSGELKKNARDYVLVIDGIHCADCERKIKGAVSAAEGVLDFRLNVPSKTALLRGDPEKISLPEIEKEINALHYKVSAFRKLPVPAAASVQKAFPCFARFLFSFAAAIFLFFDFAAEYSVYTEVAVTAAVFLFGSASFLGKKFRRGRGFFSIERMAVFAAAFAFLLAFLRGLGFADYGFKFYEACFFLAALNFGRWLFINHRNKNFPVLSRLRERIPTLARKLENGRCEFVDSGSLSPGDAILVKPGEIIPADGVITAGLGRMDETFFSGGPDDPLKGPSAEVYAGARNLDSEMEVKVRKKRGDSLFSARLKAVEESFLSNLEVKTMVQKKGLLFFSLFCALAFAAWLVPGSRLPWNDSYLILLAGLSFSVPASLLGSMPVTALISFFRLSRQSIIVNHINVADKMSGVKTAIIEAGFLLEDDFRADEISTGAMDEKEFMSLLSDVREYLDPRCGRAIEKAGARKPSGREAYLVERLERGGVRARVGGLEALCSLSLAPFEKRGIEIPPGVQSKVNFSDGVVLLVAAGGEYAGHIVFKIRLKKNATALIRFFRRMKVRPVLVSGFNYNAVRKIAEKVGVEEYYSGVSCLDEEFVVLRHKAYGRGTVFLGANTGALLKADVGVSLLSGDPALQSKDIAFARRVPNLKSVIAAVSAVNLVKKTAHGSVLAGYWINLFLFAVSVFLLLKNRQFSGFLALSVLFQYSAAIFNSFFLPVRPARIWRKIFRDLAGGKIGSGEVVK